MFNNTPHLLQDTACKLNLPPCFQNNIFCRTDGWKGLYFVLSNFNKNYVNIVLIRAYATISSNTCAVNVRVAAHFVPNTSEFVQRFERYDR